MDLHPCYRGGNADRHCCAGGLCAAGHGFVAIAVTAEDGKECGEHVSNVSFLFKRVYFDENQEIKRVKGFFRRDKRKWRKSPSEQMPDVLEK